ncbi:FAD-dependent oxidoreductase [Rhizobium sp. G21]|uniref:FAD-dependent oxidoreductase n=1 Tax=Rhizobium sp. G21 TaxID=2758439 RepID=UPI0015FFA402|nr:FAD-dependent oxidoreductase [Rhizobium sp. G21]MBB1251567.1 FAD-binding oxidoreductase [Rhizobium sp. G21]
MLLETDVAVIGGGLVGISVAYGLAQRKVDSVVVDEGDGAIRASRGNFGLVWVQERASRCRPIQAGPCRLSGTGRIWPPASCPRRASMSD